MMATSASSGGGDAHDFLTDTQVKGVYHLDCEGDQQMRKIYSLHELEDAPFDIDTSKNLRVRVSIKVFVDDEYWVDVEIEVEFQPCQLNYTTRISNPEETTMKATISFGNLVRAGYECVDNEKLRDVKETIEFDLYEICENEFPAECLEYIESKTGFSGYIAAEKIVEIAKLYDRDTDRLELLENCLEIKEKDGQTVALKKLFSDEGCDIAFYQRMIKLHFTQEASEKLLELIETCK